MIDLIHEKYMQEAIKMAKEAQLIGEVPVGAVIVDDNGAIIARGMNRVIIDNDPSSHAEIVAMRKAGSSIKNYRFVNLSLYVTLEPCVMCSGAIIHGRFKNLIFGAYDKKTGACGSVFDVISDTRHNHRVNVIGGVCENECKEMLQSFFKQRREAHKALKKNGM